AQGRTFEVALDGNHSAALSASNIVFVAAAPVDPAPVADPGTGEPVATELEVIGTSSLPADQIV
ncbi:hypothetical protein, partial [Azotobacter armeniacus]